MKSAERLFSKKKRFQSGHLCMVIFGRNDWVKVCDTTRGWQVLGWCSYDERQLFLHEVWLVMSRYKHGREWAEFMASFVKKKQ